MDGQLALYNTKIVNVGLDVARHDIDIATAQIAVKSSASEDEIFHGLSLQAGSGNKREKDLEPGELNALIKAIPVSATQQEWEDYKSGNTVIYLGILSVYLDGKNQIHHTPRCMIQTSAPNDLPGLCEGHNVAY